FFKHLFFDTFLFLLNIDTNILNLRVHTKWIHLLFVSYEDNQNLQLPYLFRFENYRSNLT
ncbi:hypothetical protein NND98_12530, partial [Enterococcus faecium]|nr:hypothetical protein [Enterococcus faecium]